MKLIDTNEFVRLAYLAHSSDKLIPFGNKSYYYAHNGVEETAQKVLNFANISKVILTYTIPLWASFIYRRGYLTQDYLLKFALYGGGMISVIAGVLVCRGFGRASNEVYGAFLDILLKSLNDPNDEEKKERLRGYDFDFKYFPLDYSWNNMEGKRIRKTSSNWNRISSQHSNVFTAIFQGLPKEAIAYVISHTFGIRLLYPGCVHLLQAAVGQATLEGRCTLVETNGGRRAKLLTEDGNEIDTMFVDRRQKSSKNQIEPDATSRHGNVLVICCEGNAGFYEVGCMTTPLKCGFSVLGWNHPGFLHSSGKPFPNADNNAMDVVMQYALHKLNFEPKNIIIFAWSIGAFTAINAAVAYPDIQGIVLDSTFYDLMPFAKKMMPAFAENLVKYTVRNYLNLHNCANLRRYKGPISFVRRHSDEVMNIAGPRVVSSNLGNQLLEDFLHYRFPNLFDDELVSDTTPYVHSQCPQAVALWELLCAEDDDARVAVLQNYDVYSVDTKSPYFKILSEKEESFAHELGKDLTSAQKTQVVLFLANKYLRHFASTHCTPLPPSLFRHPWRVESLIDQSDSSDSSDFEVVQQL